MKSCDLTSGPPREPRPPGPPPPQQPLRPARSAPFLLPAQLGTKL